MVQRDWLIYLHPSLTYFGPPDPDERIATYPPPDWTFWLDIGRWDTIRHVPPILLNHDPNAAAYAPYLNADWCARNRTRPEVKLVQLIVEHAGVQLGYVMRGGEQSMPSLMTHPVDCLNWAKARPSIKLPPGFQEAVERWWPTAAARDTEIDLADNNPPETHRSIAEVVKLPETERHPPSLPPRTPRRKREALAAAIAMRFAGIEVKGKAGAKAIGFDDDETIASYLAASQPWGKVWEAQREWAEGQGGDWGAVFKALRQWVLESDE